MTTRRRTLITIALAAIASPFASRAQSVAGIPRIGYIALPSSTPNVRLAAFRQGMRELGYVEGKSFVIEYRSAEGDYKRYPAIAAELVRIKVDVILADEGTESTLAAKHATRTIPIVFTAVNDPVASGMVASLARPGANLTGLTLQSPETTAKRLQVLKEIVPTATRIALLMNPRNSSAATWLKEVPAAARMLKVELFVVDARSPAEIDGAFEELARTQPHGVAVFDDAMFIAESSRIAAAAARLKLPTIGGINALAESGALASYGPDRLEMLRRSAVLVSKILKGAKPADMPVEQPTKFDLTVNARAAKALGIAIPRSVLLRADRVIE